MTELSIGQIRDFRLHSHHLDRVYAKDAIPEIAGACGMQNTPPGAWETALFNRVPDCSQEEMEELLYREKTLLQAWSFRGTPVVFPESESPVYLSALAARDGEPWIYTQGITLALDYLQMDFDEVFALLKQVIPKLDGHMAASKTALDQTLADWIAPYLPAEKRLLWNQPSMYGSPEKQTVGGAAVSFLLRPCSFEGLVVFGGRDKTTPTFTSYRNWTGHAVQADKDAEKKLVRKYLHCYGPTTADSFITWLGCGKKQGKRIWETAASEMEPVCVSGKKSYILSSDKDAFSSPPCPGREILLLGGHDPFLDQRDRTVPLPDKSFHKQVWKLVANPGTVVRRGEIIGTWNSKKKRAGMEITINLWDAGCSRAKLGDLAEEYAVFRQEKLVDIKYTGG